MEGMRDTFQDFRYAIRQLRRTRSFTVLAVLTLGLGIGVHTAFFGIVNAVIARIAPFSEYDRVHLVSLTDRRTQARFGISEGFKGFKGFNGLKVRVHGVGVGVPGRSVGRT